MYPAPPMTQLEINMREAEISGQKINNLNAKIESVLKSLDASESETLRLFNEMTFKWKEFQGAYSELVAHDALGGSLYSALYYNAYGRTADSLHELLKADFATASEAS